MKILVTGGSGFIGSALVERLVNEGHDVTSLDNYFTGSEENHIKGATYIKGSTAEIESLISEVPERVYHLGEYARVEKSFDDSDLVWDYNIFGTKAVVKFCLKNKCKLIYAGSSTKFGDGGLARDESPYAWTKAVNTELIKNYGSWFGLNYAITYFYNVYGPRERGDGAYATLIGIFLDKYKKGEALTVVSPGTQRRYFTHIEDIVDGLILIGEKGEGDEYGLGSSQGFSVLDVAEMIGGKIEMLPERRGNRMDSPVNVSKSLDLGWVAKRNLPEYLEAFKTPKNQ